MSESPQPVAFLNNTVGALLLGSIAAAVFYGVTSVQTYLYSRSNRDSNLFKGLVCLLLPVLVTV
ncbi:hypothetical protein PHLCEN_2v910 [Hermanssonia centrifuga]|uniref:Uncharacterized protein n=1 Tax=Hermanssonia centrifuga TaxID=98765 RepID=A0A2R6S4T3_9APHY|nr:hypothetical protein PHLCEN_2v910 [Hermanssonia centrifuga]